LDSTNDTLELENDGNKGHNLKVYSAATIMAATNSFSADNKLGQGGFGPVYKVVCHKLLQEGLKNLLTLYLRPSTELRAVLRQGTLPNGREIAVKRLSRSSGQGLVEFRNNNRPFVFSLLPYAY